MRKRAVVSGTLLAISLATVVSPAISDATPIITSTGVFTDNRPGNDPFGIFGYRLALTAEVSDPFGVPANISSVRATNLTTFEARSLFFDAADQSVLSGPYTLFVPFNSSHRGVWQFGATNRQGEVTFRNSHNLDRPARLDFPSNIRADFGSSSVQVTFNAVPGADSYNLTVYKRVGSNLVGQTLLSSTTPSFSVPKAVFTSGDQFVVRVRAVDRDFAEPGGPAENRSVNAVDISIPRVPVPTATPPISSFPRAERLLFDAVPFVRDNLQLFSPESRTALTTPLAILGPTPSSFLNELKSNASLAAATIDRAAVAWGFASALTQKTVLDAIRGAAITGITLLPEELAPPQAFQVYLQALQLPLSALLGAEFFLLDLNALIWAEGVAPQLRIFAKDPPDTNFQSVVVLGVPTSGGLPATGNAALDTAFQSLFDSTNRVVASLQAVNISIDRYGAALAAGDPVSAGLQLEAVLQYVAMYVEGARQARLDVGAVQSLLALLGGDVSFDPIAFGNLQDELIVRGRFPEEVVADLLELGLGLDQIAGVYEALVAFDPQGLPRSLFASMDLMASSLLPSPVPAPPPGILLAWTAIVLVVARLVWPRRFGRLQEGGGHPSRGRPRVYRKEKT